MLRAELLTELMPPPVRRFEFNGQVDWAKKLVKKVFVRIAVALSAHRKCDRSKQTIASIQRFQQSALNELPIRPHSSYAPGRAGTLLISSLECRLPEENHAPEATSSVSGRNHHRTLWPNCNCRDFHLISTVWRNQCELRSDAAEQNLGSLGYSNGTKTRLPRSPTIKIHHLTPHIKHRVLPTVHPASSPPAGWILRWPIMWTN